MASQTSGVIPNRARGGPGKPPPPPPEPPSHGLKHSPIFRPPPSVGPIEPGKLKNGRTVNGVQDLRSLTVTTARIQRNAALSVSDSTLTTVTPDNSLADVEGIWDGSATYLLIPYPATWEISYNLRFNSHSGMDYAYAYYELSTDNGSNYNEITRSLATQQGDLTHVGVSLHCCWLDSFDRNDRLRLRVFQDSGASVNVTQTDIQVQYRGGQ